MLYIPINPVPPGEAGGFHSRALTPGNQWYGPYEFAGKLWVVTEVGQPSLDYEFGWHLAVFSSSDNGLTWTEEDSANHPVGYEVSGSVYYPGSGATIYLAYKRRYGGGLRDISIQTFTMGSPGAWGAQVTGGPALLGGASGIKLVVRSTGQYVVSYNTAAGVYYATYSAGWSGSTAIALGGNLSNEQIQLDAADMVRFYWSALVSGQYRHRSLDSLGAFGTSQLMFTQTLPAATHVLGVPTIWDSKIYLPFAIQNGADYDPAVAIGDPSGAADPAWSVETITSAVKIMPPYNADNASSFAIVGVDGKLYVFWCTPVPTYGSGGMNSIYYAAKDGGGWAAPVLYHTEAASNPNQDWFHNPSVTLRADGTWGVVADRIYETAGGDTWSVTGFLGEPAPVVSLRPRIFYRKPFFPGGFMRRAA